VQDDSKNTLRLDRRLVGRRGWIENEELTRELARLPDVAAKAELIDTPSAPGDREESSPQGG
jgi:hypothetical protein